MACLGGEIKQAFAMSCRTPCSLSSSLCANPGTIRQRNSDIFIYLFSVRKPWRRGKAANPSSKERLTVEVMAQDLEASLRRLP